MAIIAREKLAGLGKHWGVLMLDGMVIHNTAEANIQIVSYEEFASGKKVEIVRNIPQSEWLATNWRIHHELHNPKKYHLTDNNCEIVANRIAGLKPESQQVIALAVLAIIGLIVFLPNKTLSIK